MANWPGGIRGVQSRLKVGRINSIKGRSKFSVRAKSALILIQAEINHFGRSYARAILDAPDSVSHSPGFRVESGARIPAADLRGLESDSGG